MNLKSNNQATKRVYLYIPGLESINVLYFLNEKYGNELMIISNSISVHQVCELLELKYMSANYFRVASDSKFIKKIKNLNCVKKNSLLLRISNLIFKLVEFIQLLLKIFEAKKVVEKLEPSSKLYYSTLFIDVVGIIFLGAALENKNIIVRLIWPSKIRFNKFSYPSFFKITYWINILTGGLFVLHRYPSGGVFVGVSPDFLKKKGACFSYGEYASKFIPQRKYIKRAISLTPISWAKRPKILFLGDYSVENGIEAYGQIYVKIIELLGKLEKIDTYYKPHPMYTSIEHPSLKKIAVLDTQIPVELLDDGSWLYIVGFYTASLMKRKESKCICLLKLEEIQTEFFDLFQLQNLMIESDNKLIYPNNLESLKNLLQQVK